jgi:DNA-binding CsgD family transcriptional regulator
MRGETEGPESLNGAGFDEAQFVDRMKEGDTSATQLLQYYTMKTQLAYLAGACEPALHYAENARTYVFFAQELPHNAECRLYEALSIASLLSSPMAKCRGRLRSRLKAHARQMRRWSKHSPENFSHRALLLEAELARLRGRRDDAAEKYDQAIRAAKESGYIQHEAIACERAALHYADLGRDNVAGVYARDAFRSFMKWGATAKIGGLIRKFPQLRDEPAVRRDQSQHLPEPRHPALQAGGSLTEEAEIFVSSTGSSRRGLDLAVMMKITRTVSGELDLEQCVHKLMRLVIEYAGAQRGGLILEKDGGLVVDVALRPEGNRAGDSEPAALEEGAEYGSAIIEYAARTLETVILDDAAHAGRFANDSYVNGQGVKSVLAMPVIVHGRLEGMLYLENNLAAGAFSAEQQDLLGVLASQMIYVRKLVESIERDNGPYPDASLPEPDEGVGLQEPLTEREIEVLSLMAAGMSNKEIAGSLVIAEGTVKVHIKNIFAKLKVNRRTKAVAQAKELKLLKEG